MSYCFLARDPNHFNSFHTHTNTDTHTLIVAKMAMKPVSDELDQVSLGTHTHTHTCICTLMHICTGTHMHAQTRVHTRTHINDSSLVLKYKTSGV